MRNRHIILGLLSTLSIVGACLALPVTAQAAKCGDVETSVIDYGSRTGKDAIVELIRIVVRIMTAGIGILAVGAVVFGAVLYTSSGATPDNVKRAKNIWMNTVIGLLLFAFMAALMNFLVPGGVF